MFVTKPRKVSLTLFCYLALFLAVATVAQADTANHNVGRDHVVLHRMIKKRADIIPGLGGTNGAAGDPPSFESSSSASVATSSTASSSSASASSSAASSSSASSVSASQTSASSSATSSSSASSASSSSASSSSSSSSSSSASSTQSSSSVLSTSSSTQTSAAAQPTNTDTTATPNDTSNNNSAADDTTSKTAKSVNFQTQTVTSDASATATPSAAASVSGASSSIPKAALTVIIVIASCVGAIAIGFTIIRKWKFKPSSDFDSRMAPIDWQPASSDEGIPGLQRNASTASHGSFHSAGHSDENFAGRGVGNSNYGTTGLQPIPDHDFTAGAALAPVGGYADLARGPSPGPQMSQLARGPSVGHGFSGQQDPYAYNPRY